MRPDIGYYEDSDDFEDFSYARSQALNKLLREHRREERARHEHRHRDHGKYRKRPDVFDWDDHEYDSFVDDNYGRYYEDRTDSY